MFSDELLRKFIERFDANLDRYALGKPVEDSGKYTYFKVKTDGVPQPLTFEVLRSHLQGHCTVGVYPVRADLTARWFAIDYDAPKNTTPEEGYALTLAAAKRQQRHFFESGLFTYVERSRSGSGVHLWGFLREPAPANTVRQAMLQFLLPELERFVDRGKIYPADPDKSENQTLICLPYGGKWVPSGHSMFINNRTNEPWPLEDFLQEVKLNSNEAVERLAAKAPRQSARNAKGEPLTTVSAEGRPDPLLPTGILKLFSPIGCQFLYHTWADRHDRGDRRVTEPEWYAALGQLSAFEHGREAAHLLWGDYEYYNPEGMNEKFNHACQSPPPGCAFIHERFPRFACEGCPMTAPYYLAEKSLLDLSHDSVGGIEHGQYDDDRGRIQRRNTNRELAGIDPGVAGLGAYTRLRDTELIAIGAQPSIGKTALMVDMACNIGSEGVEVYMFSAESSREVVHDRLIAHEALVDSKALRGERAQPLREDEWARIDTAIAQLRTLPIRENYAATSPDDMLRLIEHDRLTRGVPWTAPMVVLFDYLQYGLEIPPGESGEYRAINRRLYELKALRRALMRPVVFFSQLTRDTEGKDKPAMNWWSGSGKIEAVIDQGWIITGERVEGTHAPRVIHIVKQKEGSVGVKIEYILQQTVCRYEARQTRVEPTAPDPMFDSWTQES